MQVIAGGSVRVYEVGGVYQLYVESLIPEGTGDLAAAFQQIKEKLTAEGKNQYVIDVLRLRNLSKYPVRVVKELYGLMGKESRKALLPYEWSVWVRFFLRNKAGSLAFLYLVYPFASMGRSLMRRIRKTGQRGSELCPAGGNEPCARGQSDGCGQRKAYRPRHFQSPGFQFRLAPGAGYERLHSRL